MDASQPQPESSPEPSCQCRRRCRWTLPAICVVVLVAGFLAMFFARRGNDTPLKADAKNLSATLVTPHLDAPIGPGKNVLWCSTFQLVWNEGCRAAGGDIHLKDETPMVPALNRKAADEKDVDPGSCLVMSGLMKDDIVGKIRSELGLKFRGRAEPDLLDRIAPSLPPDGWLAYAYLFRELPFEYPLKRLDEPLAFGSTEVATFGLKKATSRMDDIHKAEQVVVLDYKDADDFVLELKPQDKTERIILAKIAPAETLEKTIEAVRSRAVLGDAKEYKSTLGMGETLIVPMLNFDVWKSYNELCGKEITTPGPLQGGPFILALQDIRFRLDERGAILKSEGAMAAKCGAPDQPRQFIFNKPFLILLERRGAERPYFALWVDNAELLVPAKSM